MEEHFNDIWCEEWFKTMRSILPANEQLHNTHHRNITFDIIVKNPDVRWNIDIFSSRGNISIHQILEHPDVEWNWRFLSKNTNIPFADIEQNPNLPWDFCEMSNRTDIQMNFVFKTKNNPWNWNVLSNRPDLTKDFVLNNMHFDWNWSIILNSIVTVDDIVKNANKNWNLLALSLCKEIPTNVIVANLRYGENDHCFEKLSYRKDLPLEIVDLHPNELWNWTELGSHPKLTIEFVKKHHGKLWNVDALAMNRNICPKDFVEICPASLEPYVRIMNHPDISLKFIKKHRDLGCYNNRILYLNSSFVCSWNSLDNDKKNYIEWSLKCICTYFFHDYYNDSQNYSTTNTLSHIERIFADAYIVNFIVKY